jgi:tRNA(adenine34) deaminase
LFLEPNIEEIDISYMKEALKEAQIASESKNIPVGAVIVIGEKIISKGRNARYSEKNPVAHAEIIAIERASKALGDWRCTNATLYVTLEPCLMCIGALINARISRLVYGARDNRFGALTLYNIHENNLTNHKFSVRAGILEEECSAILKDFFKDLRK